jgi:hypothetical protein
LLAFRRGPTGEALRIAEGLLLDIELRRLKASEIVLKASGLARPVGRDDLSSFLSFEREGYRGDGSDREWIQRTGRKTDDDKFFSAPLSKIEASLDAAEAALKTLQGGGNYSGDYASVAAREHDQKIAGYVKFMATNGGICKQVVATVYSMVAELYHELLFSDLQVTLFTSAQEQIDGTLAEASGSALDKIERVADRLRDGDPESVSQGLTTCRRLIDTCTAPHRVPDQTPHQEPTTCHRQHARVPRPDDRSWPPRQRSPAVESRWKRRLRRGRPIKTALSRTIHRALAPTSTTMTNQNGSATNTAVTAVLNQPSRLLSVVVVV